MKQYFKNLDLKMKILVAIAGIVLVAAITLVAMAGGGFLVPARKAIAT